MVDNVAITAGTGTTVATDDVGGSHYQRVKISDGTADSSTHLAVVAEDAASAGGETGILAMVKRADTPANTSGTDGDWEYLQVSGGRLWTLETQKFVTVQTDITRPADTTAYAVDDCWSDSTTAPTAGGYTFTGAARISGGSGIITDAMFTTSNDPATKLFGELWIFNTSVTNINDNSAFAVSDSEIKTCVAKIPFVMEDAGNNGFYHAQALNIGFTCSGSANLRFLVRVKVAYTPASGEVLTCTLKILQVD